VESRFWRGEGAVAGRGKREVQFAGLAGLRSPNADHLQVREDSARGTPPQ
jgi:hypothetical protein